MPNRKLIFAVLSLFVFVLSSAFILRTKEQTIPAGGSIVLSLSSFNNLILPDYLEVEVSSDAVFTLEGLGSNRILVPDWVPNEVVGGYYYLTFEGEVKGVWTAYPSSVDLALSNPSEAKLTFFLEPNGDKYALVFIFGEILTFVFWVALVLKFPVKPKVQEDERIESREE